MSKDLMIRSGSAEFLIFERQTHDKGIQVRFEDGDLWLTQKAIGELFDIDRTVVTKHIKNIYSEFELDENSTSANFALVQKEGNREITRNILYSDRAIQFRRWATYILKEFSKKGYIIDKKRMANGAFFDEDYYESLLAEIREIRLSERRFYQKVTDIYATSVDYDKKSPTTIKFFKKVQNVIAKNYLSKDELESLELIVSAFLDLAENRAKRHIPMTMEDWSMRIDKFLLADDLDILKDAGKISHEIACDKALTEFEKYRLKQDKLYKSDFDLLLEEIKDNGSGNND